MKIRMKRTADPAEEKRYYEPSTAEIQDILMRGMKEFRDLCEEHGIHYQIMYGTLLGALRYGDFIPWDDDADLIVARPDYDRLISLADQFDTEEWELITYHTHEGYYIPWAKFAYKKSKLLPSRFNSSMVYGLAFDVFPFDFIDARNEQEALREALRLHGRFTSILQRLQPLAEIKPGRKNALRRAGKKLFYETVGRLRGSAPAEYEKLEADLRKTLPDENNYCCSVFGTLTFVYRTADFLNDEMMEIRGESFRAPAGYPNILAVRYGDDYMTPPPAEEQKITHFYTLKIEKD